MFSLQAATEDPDVTKRLVLAFAEDGISNQLHEASQTVLVQRMRPGAAHVSVEVVARTATLVSVEELAQPATPPSRAITRTR